ncbi:hypothetical protein [Piscinibacter sp. XHJ-5]|uniref:hypothetical protein n=1 Tax=Piscinibacter sp. XHJ-5 TaxID=3037797 RepID=UPI0024532CFE|nr:hypothetical protein [Piscinibacter sp. XHJ-5]
MRDTVFHSAAERIAFSEAVDFLDQGRLQLVPAPQIEQYVQKGLWVRDGNTYRLTDEGRRQHQLAVRERFSDG